MARRSNNNHEEITKAPIDEQIEQVESLGILSRKTFEFKGDPISATVTVKAASYRDGAVRQMLEDRARRVNDAEEVNNLADLATQIIRLITYPMIAAVTVEVVSEQISWPMEFEDFVELPEALVAQWESEVLALNPAWRPKTPPPKTPAEVKAAKEKKKDSSE